jgi:hypothetical protein
MPFDGTDYQVLSPVTHMLMDGRQRVQNGWSQRVMRQRGSVCMIGSLTITDYEVYAIAEQLILEAIHGLGYAYLSVVAFNDDLRRTKKEVLEVYDTAIALSMPTTRTHHYWQYPELIAA